MQWAIRRGTGVAGSLLITYYTPSKGSRNLTKLREVESGALALGAAGTDPLYIGHYLEQKGYDVNIHFTKEDVERESLRAKASIFVYGYIYEGSLGVHFVACVPDKANKGKLFMYNDYGENGKTSEYLENHYSNYQIFRLLITIN